MVQRRSLSSDLSLFFSGSPVQCCPAAAVFLLSMLSKRGTRRAVPTVSRGSISRLFIGPLVDSNVTLDTANEN